MKKLSLILLFLLTNISFASKNPSESYRIKVNAESRNNYELSGNDLNGLVKGTDPELTFLVGSKIEFLVDVPGHPFYLKIKAGIGKKDQVDNVKNNGDTTGIILWIPEKPGRYFYQCGKHKNMVGVINILGK